MPQGKGTYGSQVGRPPKKKEYKYGGSVDLSMENIGIPTTNVMDRSQTIPDTEEYNKGGKVPEGAMDLITKKRGDMLQSKKQKEEQKERRKKARERNLKIQRNGKKKWSGQA